LVNEVEVDNETIEKNMERKIELNNLKNLDNKINELLNKKDKFKLSIDKDEKRKIQEFLLMKYNAKI